MAGEMSKIKFRIAGLQRYLLSIRQ